MKQYTKQEAIAIAVRSATKYQKELDGKKLLIICTDKHKKQYSYELSFYGSNFLHLTGMKIAKDSNISAIEFYRSCLDNTLKASDFQFSEDGTTHLKLALLPEIVCGNLAAKMCGNYNSSRPRLYTEKLVGGIKACVGFVQDKKTEELIPNTLIREDVRNLTENVLRVVAVFRKEDGSKLYDELTYLAKGTVLESISHPKIKSNHQI